MQKKHQGYHSDENSDNDNWESDTPSDYMELESSEGSDSSFDEDSDTWIGYNDETSGNFPNSKPVFKAKSGLLKDLYELHHPEEFFYLFFDDPFIENICRFTDMYHRKSQENNKRRRESHQKNWKKPDVVEMKAFLGLLLFTGIVKKPDIKDYWTESLLFGTPGFANIFSRDHFLAIKRALHFVDEREANKDDPLYKIRPLIKHIEKSQMLYTPKQYMTIDECMIKFSGRGKFKVYIPLKPIKYGFKAYILTETESGYVMNWRLHEGGKKKEKKIR